jgi:hypothetical protein
MIRGSSMSSRFNANHRLAGMIVSAGRVVAGFLFACHGAASLFGVLGGAHGTDGGTVAFGAWPSWWASLIQLVGGALVMTGLATRTAGLLCLDLSPAGRGGAGKVRVGHVGESKRIGAAQRKVSQRARRRTQAEFVIRDATLLRGVR